MIYLDAGVALSALFLESRRPDAAFWSKQFVASRLFEYEILNRLHMRKAGDDDIDCARAMIARVDLIDLSAMSLARALDPFPVQVRTLDSLHLATMVFLRSRAQTIQLATYDRRFGDAALALGFELAATGG